MPNQSADVNLSGFPINLTFGQAHKIVEFMNFDHRGRRNATAIRRTMDHLICKH